MTVIYWFMFFVSVFGVICGYVGLTAKEKKEKENKYLREVLQTEHNRAEYFRKKAEHNAVFDFEKANGKKEK